MSLTRPEVLVVCPTRQRPERCEAMLRSFYLTRTPGLTDIVCYVATDDPELMPYLWMFHRLGAPHVLGPRLPIPEVFNLMMRARASAFYVDCNDDFIFHTPGWDRRLREELARHGDEGMAYGQTRNLPAGSMTAARSIRRLGWWFPPGFNHLYVDNVQRDLYRDAGLLWHVPEVNIEHRHYSFGLAAEDATYRAGNSAENWQHDREAYARWRAERMETDLRRLKL